MFRCPFNNKIENLCCDFGGMQPEPGDIQCPTCIFNKCQAGEDLNEDDKKFVEGFIAKHKKKEPTISQVKPQVNTKGNVKQNAQIKKSTIVGIVCIIGAILAYMLHANTLMQYMISGAIIFFVVFNKRGRQNILRCVWQTFQMVIRICLKSVLKV